jgi:pyridoxamine 5'-phosphate oxidase
MTGPRVYDFEGRLPDDLPSDPMPTLKQWFDEAAQKNIQPNPNAMSIATVDPDGLPSTRIVLCKKFLVEPGVLVFFTNRQSDKGRALAARPRIAAGFFWDALDRQAVVEGPVLPSPDDESDAYFAERPLESRLAAWASEQSRPVESRQRMLEKVRETWERFGVGEDDEEADIPRPPHWGGFRIWAQRVQLWVSGPGRLHDRAEWTRDLTQAADAFNASPWRSTRLQP